MILSACYCKICRGAYPQWRMPLLALVSTGYKKWAAYYASPIWPTSRQTKNAHWRSWCWI